MRSYTDEEKEYLKRWREERWYDSRREIILERDGYRCVKCKVWVGKGKKAIVHHKDGKGRGYMGGIDNGDANLETLCRACHRNRHAKRSLELLLQVAANWDASDRSIAKVLGISHPTVKLIRKAILEKNGTGAAAVSMVSRSVALL